MLLAIPAWSGVAIGQGAAEQTGLGWLDPNSGKPGGLIAAHGDHLDQKYVGELWLRREGFAAMTRIVDQNPNVIRFRIPASTPTGWYDVRLYSAARKRIASGPVVKLFVA
jgi:hypothetical protein